MRIIIKAKAEGRAVDYHLVYTGAENDPTLESSLFEDLGIPHPDVCLGVDCVNLNELTGRVMSEFEKYLDANRTDVVIVVDDLASTMAVAIVAKKHGLTLAHLVAGTRSFDINMPKEINRLVIDGLSDLLFTAGIGSTSTATREGAELANVYMVGNILMDTLRFNRSRLVRPSLFDTLQLKEHDYIVFTLNRKALLADRDNLGRMLTSLCRAAGDVKIKFTNCTAEEHAKIYRLVRPFDDELVGMFVPFGRVAPELGQKILNEILVLDHKSKVPILSIQPFSQDGYEYAVKVRTMNVADHDDLQRMVGYQIRKFNACRKCLKCESLCRAGAISIIGDSYYIDPQKCVHCKMCVTAKYLDGGCMMDKYLRTK